MHADPITAPVVAPAGTPPSFGNFNVLWWSLIDILELVAIVTVVIFICWYLLKQNSYKRQFLDKLDSLILLLQPKNTDDK